MLSMTTLHSGVKLSTLNGHLICGLCGGYLIDATVLTECIHVFCRSCILKYLLENKICPLCQSLIQETRPGQALRPDTALQRIVYKLVPGLLKTEMKRLSEFQELSLKESLCTENIVCSKEVLAKRCYPCFTASYSVSDLCSSPLPTALATRSLSKSPCGLISSTHSTQMLVSNRLPSSAAFLVPDDEFVSLALMHLTSLPSYSKVSDSLICKRQDNFKLGSTSESSRSQPPSPHFNRQYANSIYLLCPAVVTVANLHHLLLSKYQLDPARQIVDLYLNGECLEPSHSLREIMSNEVISCVKQCLHDFGVCECCISRLTNGRCQRTDFLSVFHSQAYPDEYICKICFGLLHNHYLCDIPRNLNELQNEKMEFTNEEFNSYVLLYLYKQLNESRYQFTAYQLQVTEPINVVLREQFLWDELICISMDYVNSTLSSSSSSSDNLSSLSVTFTKNDINSMRSYTIPVKTGWKWIVEEKLSSLLKAPLIYSLRDDTELKQIKASELNINNSNCDREANIICLNLEFSNISIQSDYDMFLSYLELSPLDSIRSWIARLKNAKLPRKRSRFNYSRKQGILKSKNASHELMKTDELSFQMIDSQGNSSIFNPSSVINIGYILPNSFCFSRGFLTELLPLLKDTCLQSNYLRKISNNNCPPAFITSLKIFRSLPLYLAGRYVKLSRRLPQSPWIIGSQRKLDSSVEELITHLILPRFGTNAQSCFITAGREDVDVRCLGLGRPFAIEIINYELLPSEIIQQWSTYNNQNKLGVECCNDQNNPSKPLDLLKLASYVNSNTQNRVFIRDLQLVSSKSAAAALKLGEMQKAKCYRAVCWCPQGGLNTELLMKMQQYTSTLISRTNDENINHIMSTVHWPPLKTGSLKYGRIYFGPLQINQLTPIRVLHRRPLLNRKRIIYHLCFMSFVETMKDNIPEFDDFRSWSKLYPQDELFILEIRCEAGTYVKELVHGDLGRSNPSLASIFGRQLDILALDVTAVELNWPTRLRDPSI
ncbi:hypothetical protein MN116_006306 [Schistosoma mekongi]|uniref:tRNA pseudouridine(55) synthase n=1 Tax=Schistosoma mekongi TaxID=38744 RepID=A0AAE2D4D8_SCHME|nr:hypothetical protein MN116_006306 [Schistosoma mekongi]